MNQVEIAAMTFGQRLRELRIRTGLTQQQLALKAKISISTVARLEQTVSRPRAETVQQIATALGVQPDQFEPEANNEN